MPPASVFPRRCILGNDQEPPQAEQLPLGAWTVGCPPHTSAPRQVPVLLVVPVAIPDALPTQTCQSQGGASSASHESRVSAANGPWGRGAGLAFRFLGVDLRPRAASLLHWGPRQGTPPQCRAPAPSLTDGVCMWTQSCHRAGQLPETQSCAPLAGLLCIPSVPCVFRALDTGRVCSPRNSEELLWGHFPTCLRSPLTSTSSLA